MSARDPYTWADTPAEHHYIEDCLLAAQEAAEDNARDNADHNQRVDPLPWVAALPDPWLEDAS